MHDQTHDVRLSSSAKSSFVVYVATAADLTLKSTPLRYVAGIGP